MSEYKFININGIRTCYKHEGTGVPVLLLHGWGANLDSLLQVFKYFSKFSSVYALDFPGFGRSGFPNGDWSVDDYSDWVIAFMDNFGIDKADVLGHSFGGRVTIMLSTNYPEKVNYIILIDSAGVNQFDGSARLKIGRMVARNLRSIKNRIPTKYYQRWRIQFYKLIGSTDYLTTGKMRGTYSKVISEDLEPLLSKICQKTLLIWGEHDKDTPIKDAKLMDACIPNSTLAVIPDAGHYPFIDQKDKVLDVLESFYSQEVY